MSDLVEFLHARLDEDEAAAKAAPPESHFYLLPDGGYELTSIGPGWVMAVHPARVLREVAAKRGIMEQVADVAWGSYAVRDVILGHLASGYAGHPDYDPAWSPGAQP